jgi:hypothetical protein
MSVQFGVGQLGKMVLGSPSSDRFVSYQITWDDLLWCARMLEGESGLGTSSRQAAVLWCMASRFLHVFSARTSFHEFLRKYSSPINPKFLRDGEFCAPGGRYANSPECSPRLLDRRDRIQTKPWEQFPENFKQFLVDWSRGLVPNPVPRAVDFSVPGVGNRSRVGGAQARGFFLVWDELGRSIDSLDRNGNAFYGISATARRRATESWPDNYVKINYSDTSSSSTTPEEFSTRRNTSPASQPEGQPSQEQQPEDRTEALTLGRTSPPRLELGYSIVSESEPSVFDPNAFESIFILDPEVNNLLLSPQRVFLNQTNAMKEVTTLEMNQVVPVIAIFMRDISENGETEDFVNLNEKIFSLSPLHNAFTQEDATDRPLASIVSFSIRTQQPSVGGVAGISVANLVLKIHRLSDVKTSHPLGKYISNFFRQGYNIRIRYGVEANIAQNTRTRITNTAFQWIEEDFIVSQYNASLENELNMELNVTLIPAHTKLLSQMKIGESLPVETINSDDVESVSENNAELRQDVISFQRVFNETARSPGARLTTGENNDIGSTLRGAISNFNLFREADSVSSVRVENFVQALSTIQARMLARRYENIFSRFAYRVANPAGVLFSAVNVGPIVHELVGPEIRKIASYVGRNGSTGRKTSLEQTSPQSAPRTSVKMIFGNFNSLAGQWAQKPISSFPINIEAILSYLREEREVGSFSNNIDQFLSKINSTISESQNFVLSEANNRIEIPSLKYSFYPNPFNESEWIFYIFDTKQRTIQISNILRSRNENLSEEEIISVCEQNSIPWIKLGSENSFIRNLTAQTISDDLIAAHNIIQANRNSITQRDLDGSSLPVGISRDFMASNASDPSQRTLRSAELIIPLRITVDSFMLGACQIFSPIYILTPMSKFTGLYTIYEVSHEISNGSFSTKMSLNIELSTGNRL